MGNPETTEKPLLRRSVRNIKSSCPPNENEEIPLEKHSVKLPYIKYEGEIIYYTDAREIAEASDSLMQWVNKQTDVDVIPIAFDMEWPFSFQTGPGKTAVIQMCADERVCYIFHLTLVKKIPAALVALLKHPKVRLHGLNIKGDIRKLNRDFPEVNVDILLERCVDLGVWCNKINEGGCRWSLERLCNHICGLSMDKSKKIRMSKWHIIPLDDTQKMYAAIDVYIGQVIYRKLEEIEKLKIQNEQEFLKNNGEAALKAVKSLGHPIVPCM